MLLSNTNPSSGHSDRPSLARTPRWQQQRSHQQFWQQQR